MDQNKIVIYQTQDGKTSIDVKLEQDTVWLTANQMSLLFDKDEKTIRKHINNVFKEGEVDKDNNTQKMRVVVVKQSVAVYTLDVIISVGYRVNSRRATTFRRWATNILKEYLIRGIAINDNRLKQLGEAIKILKRTTDQLDAKQGLAVVEQYTMALDLAANRIKTLPKNFNALKFPYMSGLDLTGIVFVGFVFCALVFFNL